MCATYHSLCDWVIKGDLDEDAVISESESEEEAEKAPPSDVEGNSTVKVKKRSRKIKDKTNLFPSRRSINKWLTDATYLNLKLPGEEILNKESSTVTVRIPRKQQDIKCLTLKLIT